MDHNETNRNRTDLQISFADSFAHIITGTIGVVATAPTYEGLDQWVYVAFAALPDDLRRDIQAVFDPVAVPLIFWRLAVEKPDIHDFTSFIGWLSVLDDGFVREMVSLIFDSLAKEMARRNRTDEIAIPELADEKGVRAFLLKTECEWSDLALKDKDYFEHIVRLLTNPDQLKAHLVFTATRFWEKVYRKEYEETRGLIGRSIAYHRQARYGGTLDDIYLAVTGKVLSAAAERRYSNAEALIFVPSCHTGPYVRFVPFDKEGKSLLMIFNARTQSGDEDHPLSSIQKIFPPLKALADETRLEILGILADGELYAQQIVDRMEISQPAVSRHLGLMVAGGVLAERKETGMKFYQIRTDTLTDLAQRIAALSAWGSE
ncbi:metalloregulator ArsR/SmtB family transcription factor [Candidatus Bipolaricaulota bacterium]|nr:metalloregulator ArsR/SmtB family transcription factor [Candidatus Bipolaricaulota bacterium]